MLCIFELEHAERYQFFDQEISTNRRGLVVWQRDRYAIAKGKRWFKPRQLPRKKGKRKSGCTGESGRRMRREKEKERGRKR